MTPSEDALAKARELLRKHAISDFQLSEGVARLIVEAKQEGRDEQAKRSQALIDNLPTYGEGLNEGKAEGARAEHSRMMARFDSVVAMALPHDRLRAALDADREGA